MFWSSFSVYRPLPIQNASRKPTQNPRDVYSGQTIRRIPRHRRTTSGSGGDARPVLHGSFELDGQCRHRKLGSFTDAHVCVALSDRSDVAAAAHSSSGLSLRARKVGQKAMPSSCALRSLWYESVKTKGLLVSESAPTLRSCDGLGDRSKLPSPESSNLYGTIFSVEVYPRGALISAGRRASRIGWIAAPADGRMLRVRVWKPSMTFPRSLDHTQNVNQASYPPAHRQVITTIPTRNIHLGDYHGSAGPLKDSTSLVVY
ncbi:hypothetical protein C8Q78DRAFT_15086 [Trametes maxima]|nr:hypothetical protein C8Q78DRAFT_15086 [Trametes maxima]